MKLLIGLVLLFSFTQFANAGDRAGNGGDAIICYDRDISSKDFKKANIISTQLKDYWEYSQMIENLKISLGPKDSYRDKVMFVLKRLMQIDSIRAKKLIKRFKDESFFSLVGRGQIQTLNDSNSYLRPSKLDNCIEVQVAFQILRPRTFQSKVLIDKAIFESMSEDHKAGLILHELLYEQDIKYAAAVDSDTIRWFNYIISSDITLLFDDLESGFSKKYSEMIVKNNIDYFSYAKKFESKNVRQTKDESPKNYTHSSSFLPKKFDITNSRYVFNKEVIVQATIDMNVIDKEMILSNTKIQFVNSNVSYHPKDGLEILHGRFFYSFNSLETTLYKIKNSKIGITYHVDHGSDLKLQGLLFQCVRDCYFKRTQNLEYQIYGTYLLNNTEIRFFGKNKVFALNKAIDLNITQRKVHAVKKFRECTSRMERFFLILLLLR